MYENGTNIGNTSGCSECESLDKHLSRAEARIQDIQTAVGELIEAVEGCGHCERGCGDYVRKAINNYLKIIS